MNLNSLCEIKENANTQNIKQNAKYGCFLFALELFILNKRAGITKGKQTVAKNGIPTKTYE